MHTYKKHTLARAGFTIVELLIVIVVIAILAAITVVAYNGIANRAIESSMKSDLRNAATALQLDHTRTGSYPANSDAANEGKGLKGSGDNQLTYTTTSYGYCLSVANGKIDEPMHIRSDSGTIETGACSSGLARTWTAYPAPASGGWWSVTFGNGRFVAVAYNGTSRIMTSTDGATWTAVVAPEQNSWSAVTFGNGRFVAVASTGTNRVMSSTDGLNWSAHSVPLQSWGTVTYGNGRFVASASYASDYNNVMTSTDGMNWTPRATDTRNGFVYVASSGNLFVGVQYAGIKTSTDGITWTARTIPSSSEFWSTAAYGDGRFVVRAGLSESVSGNEHFLTSTDGISWTLHELQSRNNTSAITYGDGRFVTVSTEDDYSSGGYIYPHRPEQIAYSTDGVSWTSQAAPSTSSWRSITYGNGCFVAVAISGANQIMRSCQ